jgi:hypothetical protein
VEVVRVRGLSGLEFPDACAKTFGPERVPDADPSSLEALVAAELERLVVIDVHHRRKSCNSASGVSTLRWASVRG